MFPLFNYNFGLNNRFPSPKAIHPARPNIHRIAESEPVMSGNAIAAAAVALAASCVIMFFAFRKGKSDKVIKAISGATPTTPPPSSAAASAFGGGGGGGGGGAGAIVDAISRDPVAVAASSHSASHTASHSGGESVPVRTSSLERPVAEASPEAVAETAGRTPVADTPVEPSIADLDGRPPLDEIDEFLMDPEEARSGHLNLNASGEQASLADDLGEAANKNNGLDLSVPDAADVKGAQDADNLTNPAGAQGAPGAAGSASSANKGGAQPPPAQQPAPPEPPASRKAPTPPASKVVEMQLPDDDYGEMVYEVPVGKNTPLASSNRSLNDSVSPPADNQIPPKGDNIPPKGDKGGSTPPAAPDGSAPPSHAASAAIASGAKKTLSAIDLGPPIQELSETMLKAPFVVDGKLISMPFYDESGKLLGCSRFERNQDGQILRNSIYDSKGKWLESIEIDYKDNGEIGACAFLDNMGTYISDLQGFDKATKDNPKYDLLKQELSIAASKGKPPKSGSGAPPAAPVAPVGSAPPVPPPAAAAPSSAASLVGKFEDSKLPIKVADAMLQKTFINADGRIQSAPVKDAAEQLLGCSRLFYTKEGRIKASAFYGADKKLQDSVEIVYNEYGQIEKFVFSDGTEKYAAAFDDDIAKMLGDDPKYSLLIKGFEKEVTLEAEKALNRGALAFEAGDYEGAVKSWRPLTKIRNVAIPENLYEAEFQVGAAAYRKSVELRNAGEFPAADAKCAEAFEAWSALEKLENKGSYHNYKGLCHEVMGNHEKAVEAFANGVGEDDAKAMINLARHCESGQGLPNGKDLNLAAELYQKAGATAEAERVAQTIENIRIADEALANLANHPLSPHPSQVLAETFSLPLPATPLAVKSKSLPPELVGANPKALGERLFGVPKPVVVADAAVDLSRFEKGNAVFQEAMRLYNANDKVAANEQFEIAMGIYKPLLEHDTDGAFHNAVGQCCYGMGDYNTARVYYGRALGININCKKANENLGLCFATGNGFEGATDLEVAIELYKRGDAKAQLERILKKSDLAEELRIKAQYALDELNSVPQAVVTTTLGHHTADASAVLN